MGFVHRLSCGLLAATSLAALAWQSPAFSSGHGHSAAGANAFKTGKLRAVMIGDALPMQERTASGYDGLSVVVLEAIRDQMATAPERKASSIRIEPVTVGSALEGLRLIRSGAADIACGVAFSWERQATLNYTLPFAMGGVRLLTPAGIDGTPESLKGQTIGVINDSVAAKVLEQSVPGAQFRGFNTPEQALAALKSGSVSILGGDSLWLKANQQSVAPTAALVPTYPYARSGVGCVVSDSTPRLLNISNLAIGRLLSAYVNNNGAAREEVNRWVGSDSTVGLTDEQISTFFTIVLSTAAQFTPQS